MNTFGLFHDDPLWLRCEVLYTYSQYCSRIRVCFGSTDMKEPLIGIYKHILLHFIYFLNTRVSVPQVLVNCVTTI